MNNLVITRPRRQPKRAWGDRIYAPTLPVRQPLDAPDTRPEPKVSDAIVKQLQAPATRVVSLTSLPYGWQNMEEFENHIYVGRRDDRLHCDGYFGNPFTLGKAYPDYGITNNITQAQALALYREVFLTYALQYEDFTAKVAALSGKVLVASDTCCALVLAHTVDMLAA